MAGNNSIENFIFFEGATTTGSKDYSISRDANQMMIKIISSGTFSIKLTADISPKNSGNLKPYCCYQIPSMTAITDNITDASYLYSVDLTSIDYLRIEVVSLTGSISIYGKVVG